MHFTIVSYTFPPSKEIGGRRWAKFSQQLARKGYQVTVICSDSSASLEWYKREFPGIEIKVLPKCYPDWLSGYTRSFSEKIKYNFYTRLVSPFTKQNLFDRGYKWKKPLIHILEELHHQKPIDVLVASGAPFSLLEYASEFKSRHKEIVYIADLRDPWTWGSYYGMPDLSLNKKKFQEASEKKSINASDMVCYPTKHMGDFLKEKYPSAASKLYLLPHAYDPEKFSNLVKSEKRDGFIYGGSLYPGIDQYLIQLAEIVEENPNSQFKWDIYTGSNYPLIDGQFANGRIQKHDFVPEEELFQKIHSSAAYLAIFPRSDKDLISTKFFEIIYTQTPILYIGEEGEVGKFVRDSRIGVHILPENLKRDLPKYLNGNVPCDFGHFDVSQFTFEKVTENFLLEIKELRKSN